jgi:hypothetical protein
VAGFYHKFPSSQRTNRDIVLNVGSYPLTLPEAQIRLITITGGER